jgi:HEAT repeat protein
MYQRPETPGPRVVTVAEGATALWLRALGRPEAEMKCRAAQAIALAHRSGVRGLETTVAPLLAELDRPDQHPTVRLAVAQALLELEAREALPSLLRNVQSGDGDFRDLVEPALARRDYALARPVWLARLREPAAPPRSLVLAIQGLAAAHEEQAAAPMRDLVLRSEAPWVVRLEAARALGSLRTKGLEKDADALAADGSPRGLAGRLAAASLLRRHRSAEAVRLLQRLAADPEPAVAAPAVARLIEIDPKLVLPTVEALLSSRDGTLRGLAVEAVRREPAAERVRLVADRLDDPQPEVRTKARQALRELAARPGLRERVTAEASRVLAGEPWRGLEQAAILLAQLGHKPAAGRLVELLTHGRPEVFVSAAWALRTLAVPESLPGVVRYVGAKQKELRANADHPDALFGPYDRQLSQLNQFLGQEKYGPADPVLRAFIPRMDKPMQAPVCQECRTAAIWALGLLHEAKVVPELVPALEARLNDSVGPAREDGRVCRMAGITLGRMRARDALPSLRKYCPEQVPSLDPIHNGCGWAIEQITGQAMQPPGTVQQVQDVRFFLSAFQ